MAILGNTGRVISPGERLIFTNGYEEAEKYPTARDSEVPIFDSGEDYVYIKRTDSNGYSTIRRMKLVDDPIPKFDPKLYVSVDDFNDLKKEVRDGFNSIQQSITDALSGGSGNVKA